MKMNGCKHSISQQQTIHNLLLGMIFFSCRESTIKRLRQAQKAFKISTILRWPETFLGIEIKILRGIQKMKTDYYRIIMKLYQNLL
jgi:hypothetical protein